MDFLQKLDFMMEKYSLNKRSLSKNSGIPYTTIDGWYKKGYEGMKMSTLKVLSDYFNTIVDYWVTDEVTDPNEWKANGFVVSTEEMGQVQKYRLLDPYGKEAVDSVLNVEWRRCEEARSTPAPEPPRMVEKLIYVNPAAAGTPLYAESDFERMEFPENEVPHGADFGIKISGRSMEPDISDGDIVWVHKTAELNDGEVGVFMINDSATCKRYYKNDDDTVRLESDNPEFGPVRVSEFDSFALVGRVIGKV